MRDREDFMERLHKVRVNLRILTEDIKYPLDDEGQQWLDGANVLIEHLFNIELKKDIETVLRVIGAQQKEEQKEAKE